MRTKKHPAIKPKTQWNLYRSEQSVGNGNDQTVIVRGKGVVTTCYQFEDRWWNLNLEMLEAEVCGESADL